MFFATLALLLSRVCLGVRFPLSDSFKPDPDSIYTLALNQTVAISAVIDASVKQRWVSLTCCTFCLREESNFASLLSPLVIGEPYLALQRETVGAGL